MIILHLLYVLLSLSFIFCSDRETRCRRRQTIHHPFVWIHSAAANVFPRIEEYASTEPCRSGSRNIDAYVCSGVKSVIRVAEKAEAGAGDLPTCPSAKRIRNGRVDTASSQETEVMVAPSASETGLVGVFTAAWRAYTYQKWARNEGTTLLLVNMTACAFNTSPPAIPLDETNRMVSSLNSKIQSVIHTQYCCNLSYTGYGRARYVMTGENFWCYW